MKEKPLDNALPAGICRCRGHDDPLLDARGRGASVRSNRVLRRSTCYRLYGKQETMYRGLDVCIAIYLRDEFLGIAPRSLASAEPGVAEFVG
jgi:hypothetical protein